MEEPLMAEEALRAEALRTAQEESRTLVTGLITLVATLVVIILTFSVRMHFRRERQKRANKRRKSTKTPAGAVLKSDLAQMKQLVSSRPTATQPPTTMELLLAVALTPAIRSLAPSSRAQREDLASVRSELRRHCPELELPTPEPLKPEVDAALLLLQLLLHEWRLHDSSLTLSDEIESAMDDMGSAAVRLLVEGGAEGAQTLSQALAAAKLAACLRLGLWSWDDPDCVEIQNERLAVQNLPRPRISAALEARRWMGGEQGRPITPGTTVQITVTVSRHHAGEAPKMPDDLPPPSAGAAAAAKESFKCFFARDSEGSMGRSGTLIGNADVDVADLTDREASAIFKFAAPALLGEYQLKAVLVSLGVLGVEAEAACSFRVVADAEEEEEDDDDSDYE